MKSGFLVLDAETVRVGAGPSALLAFSSHVPGGKADDGGDPSRVSIAALPASVRAADEPGPPLGSWAIGRAKTLAADRASVEKRRKPAREGPFILHADRAEEALQGAAQRVGDLLEI